MKHINTVLDRITERMIIMFTVGMMAGVLGTIIQSVVPALALSLLTPQAAIPQERVSVFETIRPKLYTETNTFLLSDPTETENPLTETFPESKAFSVVNYDTGEILAQHNADERLPIASLTKLMTAMVALDLAGPEELFVISETAARKIPTKIGVMPGEKMTVGELLHAVLMTSANDASEVLKEGIDNKYNERVFIRAMNEKARFLGLKDTRFDNPQGFDSDKNYSTAADLAILSHYAMQEYPLISEIVRKEQIKLYANKNHKQFDLYNWNGLLGVYPGIEGLKIGNTGDAGKTTVVLANRLGQRILVVLLGTSAVIERDLGAAQLLDLGYLIVKNAAPIAINKKQLEQKYAQWKW